MGLWSLVFQVDQATSYKEYSKNFCVVSALQSIVSKNKYFFLILFVVVAQEDSPPH